MPANRSLALLLTSLVVAIPAAGQPPGSALKMLSLEALGNIEVTTASKEPEEVRRTPAAIDVITQEDIRRSGATTIPEVLRLVPGVSVGRIDSGHWSVGVRGFGNQFSKSVLVLIDGRSVYTPLFAGVMWAIQDALLEDIERIEIIRGPGGTIWGANAVDGVINIITKNARDTRGALVTGGGGNLNRTTGGVRYGGRAGTNLDYRVYARGFDRGPELHSDGTDFDAWRQGQAGVRADWNGVRDTVSVHGDVYKGRNGQSVSLASFSPPSQEVRYEPVQVWGANIVAHWRRDLGDRGDVQVQGYYNRTHFLGPQLGESRHTFDVDFVHQLQALPRQSLTWGLSGRRSPSRVVQTVPTLDLNPRDFTDSIYGAFVQDEVTAVENLLRLTVGTKIEHNPYTGAEVQPSARMLWTPTRKQSAWLAATRAVRTPSRLETAFEFIGYLAPSPLTYLRIAGNPDFQSESRVSYEAGYRSAITSAVYVDVSVFHNQVDNLESFGDPALTVETSPIPHVLLTFPFANGVMGTASGLEIAPRWKPTAASEIKVQYSFLDIDLRNTPGNADTSAVTTYEGSSPRHQVRVQGAVNLPGGWESDVAVRHVSALPARVVDAYTTFDVRLGWHVSNMFEWSIAGQNLGQANHLEFGHDPGPAVALRRSIYTSITWKR